MPRHATDYTGLRYSYLEVIGPSEKTDAHGRHFWRTRCIACGREKDIDIRNLKEAQKKNAPISCGCMKRVFISAANTTHGMSKHPAWAIWHSMKQRCTEPTHQAWKNYGGRGITVCERWLNSFENFWADMGPTYQAGLELDRRDNSKGYSPENCRWVSRKTNNRNRRSNRMVETPLGAMTVAELSERSGIGVTTLLYRLNAGVASESLLTPPSVTNRFMTSATPDHDTASPS